MTTALDLISGAMRLIGVLAEGEQPTPEEAQDALDAMNQLLDSWANIGCVVHSVQVQDIPWLSGVVSKTVGPAGQFVGNRPVMVRESTYYTADDIDYDLQVISEQDYNDISLKDLGGSYPSFLYVNMTHPAATLTLYPKPSMDIVLHLSSVAELSQIPTLETELSLPPGYIRAFRYNLACEIAAEFGVEPPPTVQKNAWLSLRLIKRTNSKNNRTGIMRLPSPLVSSTSNIYEG